MERLCIAAGEGWSCDRQPRRAGSYFCNAHYQQSRNRRVEDMTPIRDPGFARRGECIAGGDGWACAKDVYAVGLCRGHYDQRRRQRGFTPFRETVDVSKRWNEAGERLCTECRRYLPASGFQRAGKGPDGLQTICAKCHRGRWLMRGYGITAAQFDAMLSAQSGVCAICSSPPRGQALAVDHDHACCPGTKSCGQCVRGLLCTSCNHGLGNFKDSPELMKAASAYLLSAR